MGSRGQPAARDTRGRETFPAVSHGKGGVSRRAPHGPPRLPALLFTGTAPGGGPLRAAGTPGLLPFLLLTTLAPGWLLLPSPFSRQHHPKRVESSGTAGWSQANSRCAQLGPGLPETWESMGNKQMLAHQRRVLAEHGELWLPPHPPPAVTQRVQGKDRGRGGEGACLPSHPFPQAGSAAKDEFVYSQDTRLPASREKGFFTRAKRDWKELAGREPQ